MELESAIIIQAVELVAKAEALRIEAPIWCQWIGLVDELIGLPLIYW